MTPPGWHDGSPRLLACIFAICAGCASSSDNGDKAATKKEAAVDSAVTTVMAEYKALALRNKCPKGYPELQGAWTFAGRSRVPEFVDDLTIEGTRFTELLSGRPDGKSLTAKLTGEIRCLFKNRVLVMIDQVVPEGAFDNQSHTSYPCDVLSPMSKKDKHTIMLLCFFDWDLRPTAGRQFVYRLRKPPTDQGR